MMALSHECPKCGASISDQLSDAFDFGHKAAGGSIVPDVPGSPGKWQNFVEIAITRDEIDAVCEAISVGRDDVGMNQTAHLSSFLEKIEIFQRR